MPNRSFPTLNAAQSYIEQRDEALANLDIEWARNQCGGGSDEMLILALHKSRYEAKQVDPKLRRASGKWLQERSYGRIGGLPWPTDGSLPE